MSVNWLENLTGWEGKVEEAKKPRVPNHTKTAPPSFPDGRNHIFRILSARLDEEKPMAIFKIQVETVNNQKASKMLWFGGNAAIPLRELLSVGINIGKKEDLLTMIPAMAGMRVKGSIVNKEGRSWPDFYFNEFIDRVEAGAETPDISFDFGENEESL